MNRLYVVVREDLPVGLAAAQVAHVAFQFATQFPEITSDWLRDSQYLIIVTVPDEVALIALASRALVDEQLTVVTFHEPDLADAATAVALAPGEAARALCGALPLLGRRPMALTG